MRKKKARDVIIFFRDLIIVITIILPNKVVISLHPSYFSPIFVLQEFFFRFLILVSFVIRSEITPKETGFIFCKVR